MYMPPYAVDHLSLSCRVVRALSLRSWAGSPAAACNPAVRFVPRSGWVAAVGTVLALESDDVVTEDGNRKTGSCSRSLYVRCTGIYERPSVL